MKKVVSISLTIICTVVLLAGCGAKSGTSSQPATAKTSAGDTNVVELKFAQVANKAGANGQGMEKFAELIKQKTNGRYIIKTFHDGQLGQENNYIEDCQIGNLDMALVNMAPLANLVPDYSSVNLPYLITSYQQADKVFWGEIGNYFLGELDGVKLKGLAIFETGFRDLSNNKREVKSVADVKGLRVRVMENPIHLDIWKNLGADPVPMSWGEAYTAMQQGAINGQENPAQIFFNLNVFEVNKYISMTDHVYSVIPIIMSPKTWKALSQEDQKIFMDAAKEASIFQRDVARKMTEDAIANVKSKGVTVTIPNKQEFIDATQPTRDKYSSQYSKVLEKIKAVK